MENPAGSAARTAGEIRRSVARTVDDGLDHRGRRDPGANVDAIGFMEGSRVKSNTAAGVATSQEV